MVRVSYTSWNVWPAMDRPIVRSMKRIKSRMGDARAITNFLSSLKGYVQAS
jgi:hypothetical protein